MAEKYKMAGYQDGGILKMAGINVGEKMVWKHKKNAEPEGLSKYGENQDDGKLKIAKKFKWRWQENQMTWKWSENQMGGKTIWI